MGTATAKATAAKSDRGYSDGGAAKVCEGIMVGALRLGVVSEARGNGEAAAAIIRAEVRAFFVGDKWAAEREALIMRSVSERYILASVALDCINQIREAAAATVAAATAAAAGPVCCAVCGSEVSGPGCLCSGDGGEG